MKPKAIKYLIIISIVVVSIFIFLIVCLSKLDTDTTFKRIDLENHDVIIDLSNYIKSDSTIIVKDIFPYEKYINSDNWKTVSSINNDLAILDSINPNHFNNLDAHVNALTIKNTYWHSSSLDSLNMLLNWIDKFNIDVDCVSNNSLLYNSVYNYWISEVALRLDSLQREEANIKYSFRYKFLKEICSQSLRASNSNPDDNTTKIVNYIIEKKWHYLYLRFCKGTSITYKTIAFSILLITLFGYYFLIIKIYNRFLKNKIENEN